MNKYIYDYLARLTDVLNTKIKTATDKADVKLVKEIEALKKELLKEIESVSKKVDETSKKEVSIDPISLYKILDKVKMYTIKNGNWYYEGKDLGIRAEAKDGKDGINGTNGRDGIDGRDGKDGNVVDVNKEIYKAVKDFATKDEVDNKFKDVLKEVKIEKIIETIKEDTKFIEPKIEIGKVETIQAGDEASVEVRKEDNTYKLDFYIPRGVSGKGQPGKGIVEGGTADQILAKSSTEDYDTKWVTPPYDTINGKIDSLENDRTIMKEPTGFLDPSLVIINYDPATQKVTLTGTITAYYQGVDISIANPTFVSGWVSTAHPATTGHTYFLYYDGTNFAWSTDSFPGFDKVLIATVNYGATNKYANRECHGFMPWQTHKELHETIGTYKSAGGTFPSAQYTLSSTTVAHRRPDIDETTIYDEDMIAVLPALTSKAYTIYNLGNASVGAYTLNAADIIPLSTNQPYYNSFSTPNWGQTLMPSNSVATVWVYAIPVTASATSQAYRYLFIQPQWITQATNSSAGALTTAVNTEALRLPSELNLGSLTLETPELVCIGKIIVAYTASNWTLRAVTLLTGNKFSQIGSPSGNYLSVVSTDTTLTGNGTGASPLSTILATASSLDATLVVDKPYSLGTLTGNISMALPTGTTQQKCRVIFNCTATPYTFTLTGTNFTTFSLTPVANTYYDIVFEYNASLSKWIPSAFVCSL